MLPAGLQRMLPERSVWLPHVVALGVAAVATLVLFVVAATWLSERAELLAKMQYHSLPPEAVCLAPYAADQEVPEAVAARLPVIRVREYAPNCYELLYWGNPIRPAYSFSVWALSTGSPALLSDDGVPQRYRPLPVTEARRADGKLPLQPAVKLHQLSGRRGDIYAARIAVHDAATGTVLASVLYLLSGSEER
ncbi:MAG: hypothetical protein IJN29_09855 [Akkermansia sp.]|nr:hypothetical protein [Akkermansia sp.]